MTYENSRSNGDGRGRWNRTGTGNGNATTNGYWQNNSKQIRYSPTLETTPSSRQKHIRLKSEPTYIGSSFCFRDCDTKSEPNWNLIRQISATKERHSKSGSTRGSGTWPTARLDDDSDTSIQSYKMPSKYSPAGAGSTRVVQCINPLSRAANECSVPDRSQHESNGLEQTLNSSQMEKALSMSNLESVLQPKELPPALETAGKITDNGLWLTSDEQDWQRMRQLRIENWAFRSKTHQMRLALRKKQFSKSTVEDRLFQLFRRKQLGLDSEANESGEGSHSMSHLMEQNQEIRDEYGPLEDLCLQLEDELTQKESELTRLEQRFDKKWARKPTQKAENEEELLPQDISLSSDDLSDEDEGNINEHPLVTQLLLKKGELNILRERVDEFWEEKIRLEDIRESRKRVGLFLAPEDQAWLDEFPTSEAKLQHDIKVLNNEVNIMRRDCLSRRLIDDQDQTIDFQGQEKNAFMDEGLDVQDKVSEYVKYPHLLPKPGYKTEPVYGKLDAESDRTAANINDWLLDMLRASPLEVDLLARTFEWNAGKMVDTWETSVLSFWYQDGTNTRKIQVCTASIADAQFGSRHSTTSRNSFGFFISS